MSGLELDGAVVVITGGAGGIGGGLRDAFAAAGSVVVTTDLPGRGADRDLDVTDLAASRRLVADVLAEHGRLDVVVANAGVGVAGLVEDLTDDDWARTVSVNVAGAVNTVTAAYPLLVTAGRGAIVLMASLSGLGGTPLLVPYSMSKHALVGLGAGLRVEAARHGVGVTVACPGPVETPMLDVPARTRGVDVRRYLTGAAGAALAPRRLADAVVDGVRHDRAWVMPGRASPLGRVARAVPGLVARLSARNLRAELDAARG